MGQMITQPDANPVILAACNWFLGALGYYMMGQKKKAVIAGIITLVLSSCSCGAGFPIVFLFMYDAYLLGQKLQSGQSIGENENGLEFLNAIFKD